MIKRPTVINMSLKQGATEVNTSVRGKSSEDKALENINEKDEGITQDIIKFIRIVGDERISIKKKEKTIQSPLKEGVKKEGKIQIRPSVIIPIQIAQSIQIILRKYMLCKIERVQDQPHSKLHKPKLNIPNTLLKANIYKGNKENNDCNQQQHQASEIFRSIEWQKNEREKLVSRNKELESQVSALRQRLREKNDLISKLLSKETQLRNKYNDQFSRVIRNKNIYDISAHFEKAEEEGEGRNMFNIAGKHLDDHKEEVSNKSSAMKSGYKSVKTLVQADSQYFKGNPNKKGKLNPFLYSRKKTDGSSPQTKLLKCINKSLPTECISKGGDCSNGANLQLCINHLQSNLVPSKPSVQLSQQQRMDMINRLKNQEFQGLWKISFYHQ